MSGESSGQEVRPSSRTVPAKVAVPAVRRRRLTAWRPAGWPISLSEEVVNYRVFQPDHSTTKLVW